MAMRQDLGFPRTAGRCRRGRWGRQGEPRGCPHGIRRSPQDPGGGRQGPPPLDIEGPRTTVAPSGRTRLPAGGASCASPARPESLLRPCAQGLARQAEPGYRSGELQKSVRRGSLLANL